MLAQNVQGGNSESGTLNAGRKLDVKSVQANKAIMLKRFNNLLKSESITMAERAVVDVSELPF